MFVSCIEFIRSHLSNFSAHVSGVREVDILGETRSCRKRILVFAIFV